METSLRAEWATLFKKKLDLLTYLSRLRATVELFELLFAFAAFRGVSGEI